jgi:recombination protein RecR
VGPEDLPLARLARQVVKDGVKEVIVATPPSVDGEATALLIKRELGALDIRITRIASGVPHGGDLEFADPITMGRALSGRQQL